MHEFTANPSIGARGTSVMAIASAVVSSLTPQQRRLVTNPIRALVGAINRVKLAEGLASDTDFDKTVITAEQRQEIESTAKRECQAAIATEDPVHYLMEVTAEFEHQVRELGLARHHAYLDRMRKTKR